MGVIGSLSMVAWLASGVQAHEPDQLEFVVIGSSGSRGAPAPLDPKTPWSPPLAPPSFWRRKDEEEGEEEERKEEISPPFKNFWIRH